MQPQVCTHVSQKQVNRDKFIRPNQDSVFTHVILGEHGHYRSTATLTSMNTGTHKHTNTHRNTQRGLSSVAAAERKKAFSSQLPGERACLRMYSKCSVDVWGELWGLLPESNQSRSEGNGPSFSLQTPTHTHTHTHTLLFLHS